MAIEYRQITAAEHRAFGVAVERGFGGHYEPNHERYEVDRRNLPVDTTLCAFDGDAIVGTSGAHPFESAVPGGAIIKNAGVTAVTVATTHRRRGLLNGMMERLLKQEREKGQPVASLWASESIIYGRYGYGMSMQNNAFKIDTRQAIIEHMPEVSGSIKFVDSDEAMKQFPVAWEAAVNSRSGMPRRSRVSWDALRSG